VHFKVDNGQGIQLYWLTQLAAGYVNGQSLILNKLQHCNKHNAQKTRAIQLTKNNWIRQSAAAYYKSIEK